MYYIWVFALIVCVQNENKEKRNLPLLFLPLNFRRLSNYLPLNDLRREPSKFLVNWGLTFLAALNLIIRILSTSRFFHQQRSFLMWRIIRLNLSQDSACLQKHSEIVPVRDNSSQRIKFSFFHQPSWLIRSSVDLLLSYNKFNLSNLFSDLQSVNYKKLVVKKHVVWLASAQTFAPGIGCSVRLESGSSRPFIESDDRA